MKDLVLYQFKPSDTPPEALYTFKTKVEPVVDGDALNVSIDLGFDVHTEQTLRLRGIDIPQNYPVRQAYKPKPSLNPP